VIAADATSTPATEMASAAIAAKIPALIDVRRRAAPRAGALVMVLMVLPFGRPSGARSDDWVYPEVTETQTRPSPHGEQTRSASGGYFINTWEARSERLTDSPTAPQRERRV
jgi:hypothetical protein